jgi:hypothetical protein
MKTRQFSPSQSFKQLPYGGSARSDQSRKSCPETRGVHNFTFGYRHQIARFDGFYAKTIHGPHLVFEVLLDGPLCTCISVTAAKRVKTLKHTTTTSILTPPTLAMFHRNPVTHAVVIAPAKMLKTLSRIEGREHVSIRHNTGTRTDDGSHVSGRNVIFSC